MVKISFPMWIECNAWQTSTENEYFDSYFLHQPMGLELCLQISHTDFQTELSKLYKKTRQNIRKHLSATQTKPSSALPGLNAAHLHH